ncbi:MAG: ATP-binding cassette domain-containing protein [Christensenellaceae bacterium]|nr:ATP-binding cassette domain-containing protein [Christensenellaceae bacterium]
MIEFSGVFLKYTKEFFALYDINFMIKKGEMVCLLGPSGSGKSCVLRVLCGLEKPTKGEVYIKNIPIKKVDFINDINVGYIPYKGAFFEKKTVYENLKYVVKLRTKNKAEQESIINKIVIDFKLEAILNTKAVELGLYQKYLVSVARLSIRELDMVLIDDIFKDLDENDKKTIISLLKEQFIKTNKTIVFATSDEVVAKMFGGRIIKLNNGSLE